MSKSNSQPSLKSINHHSNHPVSSTSNSSKIFQSPLRWTGFTKTSNLVLFSLTAGVFAIFSALQIRTLPEGNRMKPNPPGGPFWFKDGLLHWIMQIHLWSVIRRHYSARTSCYHILKDQKLLVFFSLYNSYLP